MTDLQQFVYISVLTKQHPKNVNNYIRVVPEPLSSQPDHLQQQNKIKQNQNRVFKPNVS